MRGGLQVLAMGGALLAFGLAAVNWPARWNLLATGLALWVVAQMLHVWGG